MSSTISVTPSFNYDLLEQELQEVLGCNPLAPRTFGCATYTILACLVPPTFYRTESSEMQKLSEYIQYLIQKQGWKAEKVELLERGEYTADSVGSRYRSYVLGPHIQFHIEPAHNGGDEVVAAAPQPPSTSSASPWSMLEFNADHDFMWELGLDCTELILLFADYEDALKKMDPLQILRDSYAEWDRLYEAVNELAP